jgi:conjugative transposon TraJ protein
MKRKITTALIAVIAILLPFAGHAQESNSLASQIGSLQSVLENLYDQMMPLCGQLTGVASGIAGFAAIFYIAARVWKHIANAEPIDFYPLFRPFVLAFCISIFPAVIGLMNGILQPTVTGTAAMVQNSDKAIDALLKQKDAAVKATPQQEMYVGTDGSGDKDKWYKYTHNGADPSGQGVFASIGNDVKFAMEKVSYNFRNMIKRWMSEILQVLFVAASLCINTLRTFQLIVLAIIGPLVFGFAVFDGLQHTLTAWIARYINIFLWLPVANIFGAIIGNIQQQMLQLDLSQINSGGDTVFGTADTGYLVFMIIGIIGYFHVPSVANNIIHAAGMGPMLNKVTNMTAQVGGGVAGTGGAVIGEGFDRTGSALGAIRNIPNDMKSGYNGGGGSGFSGAAGRAMGRTGAFMKDKLSGKSNS